MYERFTDDARKVMQFANQEAQRMFHEYIGTEHILLGLAKEGGIITNWVARNKVVDEVERLVQFGPEMMTMGKLPQTPRAKKVIEYAMEEARNLTHNFVGTEHLLLGLLREEEGVAAKVLGTLGVKIEVVRDAVKSPPAEAPKEACWGLVIGVQDSELSSLESIAVVLKKFDKPTVARMLNWLNAKFLAQAK